VIAGGAEVGAKKKKTSLSMKAIRRTGIVLKTGSKMCLAGENSADWEGGGKESRQRGGERRTARAFRRLDHVKSNSLARGTKEKKGAYRREGVRKTIDIIHKRKKGVGGGAWDNEVGAQDRSLTNDDASVEQDPVDDEGGERGG